MNTFHYLAERSTDTHLNWEGMSYLWLGGSNYWQIQHHPLFQEKLKEGLKRFPQHFGSSRSNNLQLSVYRALEERLAAHLGAPDALLCSSGQLAGQVLVQCLAQKIPITQWCYAPKTHPALWAAGPLQIASDREEWEKQGPTAPVLLSDGIGNPQMQAHDFKASSTWTKGLLVLDESHRLGLLDHQVPHAGTLLQISSLSKAFGIPAGLIWGDSDWINDMRQSAYWNSASPPNPAFAYAALHAFEAYGEQAQALSALVQEFQTQVRSDKISWVAGHPSFNLKEPSAWSSFKAKGILLNAFPYPRAQDPLAIRGCLHAALKKQDLAQLIHVCHEVL